MRHRPRHLKALLALLVAPVLLSQVAPTEAQTYRKTWTTTADFNESASLVNVTATSIPDQLQLNLGDIETPYMWIANSGDNTVSRIETATGRVLSVTDIPDNNGIAAGPSRTAVDLDFNCWVALRNDARGFAYKLDASTGDVLNQTWPANGVQTRGVAIMGTGEVWIAASRPRLADGPIGMVRINPDVPFRAELEIETDIGTYGMAIGPFGKMFATTGWLPAEESPDRWRAVQRIDSVTGEYEQRWRITQTDGDIYGITVDLQGNVWGTHWPDRYVSWIDGDYECPGGAFECTISEGNGIIRDIDVAPIIQTANPDATTNLAGRGIAFDANGFIWAVFNDLGAETNNDWRFSQSYAVKIDGTSGDPILAVPVGTGAVGISPDADGFIWVVNYNGGGEMPVNGFTCPNGADPALGGTVTKLRSSNGSVVNTYPTCGVRPYTYSDFGGYGLRSVTLRSGTWNATHDSQRNGLQWERVDWNSQLFDDTTLRIRARAADTTEDLATAPYIDLVNGGDLPIQGRFIQVDAFFFTQNDFIGPVLEDLTVSSECIQSAEICDGFDNDCDGEIDEDNPGGGQACTAEDAEGNPLPGICAQGIQTCVGAAGYECRSVNNPEDEVCDGQDNNCNGRVDEGVSNACGTCGPLPEEVCDGIDNDCDGQTDEGVLNLCGACGPLPEERCNGIDDDCDGFTDEGVTNACGECGPVPEETCNGEDDDCDGLVDEGVANACGDCGPVPEEVCDGQDNDCDGLVDEDLLNACGECGAAPEEICDGVDNNCDGQIDEGVRNACGTCGPPPEEVCDAVDNDCDGETDEGVRNDCGGCGPIPAEECDGVDNDCDGEIDEGVTNACGTCGLVPEEICDGVDNDCDGDTDENVTNACGECGDLPADLCDGIDNDCDGETDEDSECSDQLTCVQGECVADCVAGECPVGFLCIDNYCLQDTCEGRTCPNGETCFLGDCFDDNEFSCRTTECEGAQVCIGGTCVDDPCTANPPACGDGEACYLGECLPSDEVACRNADCGPGEICEGGQCQPDPCEDVTCQVGQACVNGLCQDACDLVTCGTGFSCQLGECVEDLCFNVECTTNQFCTDGNCIWTACIGITCDEGEQCGEAGCEPLGTCGDTVCADNQVCLRSTCVDEDDVEEVNEIGVGGTNNNGTSGTNNNGTTDTNNGTADPGDGGDDSGGGDDEGCGCSSVHRPSPSSEGPLPALALLALGVVAVGARRRRRD